VRAGSAGAVAAPLLAPGVALPLTLGAGIGGGVAGEVAAENVPGVRGVQDDRLQFTDWQPMM